MVKSWSDAKLAFRVRLKKLLQTLIIEERFLPKK